MNPKKWKVLIIMVVVAAVCAGAFFLYQMPRTRLIGILITDTPIVFEMLDQRLFATETLHSSEEPSSEFWPGFTWEWITLEFEGVEGVVAYYFQPVIHPMSLDGERKISIQMESSDTFAVNFAESHMRWFRDSINHRWRRDDIILNIHATVYVTPGGIMADDFYFYPVFQQPDSRVYLTPINARTFSRESSFETFHEDASGSSWTGSPLNGRHATAQGGSTAWAGAEWHDRAQTWPHTWFRYTLIHGHSTFAVSVEQRAMAFEAAFVEMDAVNNIIARTVLNLWEAPDIEGFIPSQDTAYIIVETHERLPDELARVRRHFVVPEGDNAVEFYVLRPGTVVFERRIIWVLWH